VVIFMSLMLQSFSQDNISFVFDDNPSALIVSSVTNNDLREHPLGLDVSKLLALLKQRYTYIEPGTPTSPHDKTIVIKPTIYNSIQKLNRYYKKEIKKDTLIQSSTRDDFLLCLKVALIIYSEDTEAFEDYLRTCKKPEQILEAYKLVVLQ